MHCVLDMRTVSLISFWDFVALIPTLQLMRSPTRNPAVSIHFLIMPPGQGIFNHLIYQNTPCVVSTENFGQALEPNSTA